ncbi:MAG TPA: pentapeptide repeat-containing protein [Bradyrhizobium sp.]|nr:pentapeptide repeat-containing protein [Bradyrhizobium sp.]
MADDKKIDPFDVEALEKSLNDSATRVSTIWISFLIFSLYLLTAATTVTHRQLFLAEPVKLPVLNIDLPLWGFFWLAPILFVIFHAYVLIQLILLARTAAAYDSAVAKLVEQDNLSPDANASLRQRLANTLFAQILAGSPREREGWFGSLLKAMAWITLVIAPILVLLTFQLMFLPYHSHLATWTHRLLILLEFIVAFKLWPLVLNPQRDFQWPSWRWRSWQIVVNAKGLFGSSEGQPRAKQGLRRLVLPMAATVLFILLSLSLATFPGEPHVNMFTGQALDDVQCRRWLQQKFQFADMRFDRVALARVDVVDHDKLEKIRQATSNAGERPYQGERARILRDRDLNCGDFSDYADLRRLDLSGAYLRNADFRSSKLEGISFTGTHLHGAFFKGAKLQGASLDDARLQGASLKGAKLQGASLDRAELQGASLIDAELQGASFDYAWLQGASLGHAQLQGAFLSNASLQGASLYGAQLQGAFLDNARLAGAFLDEAEFQGASLVGAELQGASLNRARLQGASLNEARLQSASLVRAQLQGISLDDANLDDALLSSAWIWRARGATCTNARIVDLKNDAVITDGGDLFFSIEPIPATAEQIEKFVTQWVADIPEERRKRDVRKILNERLTVAGDDTAALGEPWRSCGSESRQISQDEFDRRHVAVLREAVCDAERNGAAIGEGIARNWISKKFGAKLARALLGEDGKPCAPAHDYDEETKKTLRRAAGPPPASIAPK